MKARVAKPNPGKELILLYRPDEADGIEALPGILAKLKIHSKIVEEDQLDETVGYLAELPGYEKSRQADSNGISWGQIEAPMMLISGVDNKKMDRLLEGMQREKVDIPLKASITRFNTTWTFRRLLEEIRQEQQLFVAMERLDGMVKFAERSGFSGPEQRETIRKAKALLKELTHPEGKLPEMGDLLLATQEMEKMISGK